AFHYCANATPTAVDHHCSYNPRAGQEHMHNRVAFFTDEFPYANMDGYERLIAFKAGTSVDIAMGQVESDRLRLVQRVPPEDWDRDYPRLTFDKPLVYRRTMVMMKGGAQDYFVIRDQYQADRPIKAAYNLHVDPDLKGDNDFMKADGQFVRFANADKQVLTLFCAQPMATKFVAFPWQHENGGHESTQGVRLEMEGASGEYITVIYPGTVTPAMTAIPGGVTVGDDTITFSGGIDQAAGTTYVTVKRGGAATATLAGADINLERFQGDIGLFVPNTGYPFGDIPDWLIRQRMALPAWYKPVMPLGYRQQ
ncbi:MAG: hypothetical protein WCJ56_15485, partial [bacterium]